MDWKTPFINHLLNNRVNFSIYAITGYQFYNLLVILSLLHHVTIKAYYTGVFIIFFDLILFKYFNYDITIDITVYKIESQYKNQSILINLNSSNI